MRRLYTAYWQPSRSLASPADGKMKERIWTGGVGYPGRERADVIDAGVRRSAGKDRA